MNAVLTRWNGQKEGWESTPGGLTPGDLLSGNMTYWLLNQMGVPNAANPPAIPSDERNEAVTKALNDIADQKAAIGENLATLSQIIKLTTNPVGTLVKELTTVKNGKRFFPFLRKSYNDIVKGNLANRAAEEYLKYVYGWKPLMQDIYGLFELAKDAGNKPLLIRGTGVSRRDPVTSGGSFANVSSYVSTTVGGLSGTTKTKCTLWAQPDPEYALTRTLNQLGLTNVAGIAWETVPFSFVVDWVLPIGPVLNALTAPAGLAFVDGSISRRVSAGGDYSQSPIADPGWSVTTPGDATGTITYEGYSRESLRQWPRPGLWVDPDPLRLKGFGGNSSDRVFKALALAIAALK